MLHVFGQEAILTNSCPDPVSITVHIPAAGGQWRSKEDVNGDGKHNIDATHIDEFFSRSRLAIETLCLWVIGRI